LEKGQRASRRVGESNHIPQQAPRPRKGIEAAVVADRQEIKTAVRAWLKERVDGIPFANPSADRS
jgi:hypothetical protein